MLIFVSAAGVSSAVELALRNHAVPRGSIICLGDVAEIKPSPGEKIDVEQLAARQLMPAPAPGEVRYLLPGELLRLLSTSGLDVQTVQFTGAESVAIGAVAPGRVNNRTPQRVEPSVNAHASADAEVAAAIAQYLCEQTGHDKWDVRPTIDSRNAHAALAGLPLKVAGGKAPWTGLQRFQIDNGSGKPTLVAAQIQRIQLAVFAVRPIERGALVGVADVELRPHVGALPTQAIVSLEAIIGKEATAGIRPDVILQSNQVRSATLVRRGERVNVRVRTAGVTVRTFATAQQDGAAGDLIMVESLAGKERYTASVTPTGELEVFVARSTATDVAGRTPVQDARLQ